MATEESQDDFRQQPVAKHCLTPVTWEVCVSHDGSQEHELLHRLLELCLLQGNKVP